jgi:hypothetical protein
MQAWLAGQHAWLEGLWANLKGVELANRACRSLEELAAAAEQGSGGYGRVGAVVLNPGPGGTFPLSVTPFYETLYRTITPFCEPSALPLLLLFMKRQTDLDDGTCLVLRFEDHC